FPAHPSLLSFPTRRSSDLDLLSLVQAFEYTFGLIAAQCRVDYGGGGLRILDPDHQPSVALAMEADGDRLARVMDVPERPAPMMRSEEHTSELQSQSNLVCR